MELLRHASRLEAILAADSLRWRMLDHIRTLRLPDCWIGAGFVRNAVWDHLHGRPPSPPGGDVDVLWFDPKRSEPSEDAQLEASLKSIDGRVNWSVKNQARMHLRNGDGPYASVTDALRYWPETATAVAVRTSEQGLFEIISPFGLEDLFGLIVRPTPRAVSKIDVFKNRVEMKHWLEAWPLLRLA